LGEPRIDRFELGRLLAGSRKGQAAVPIVGLDAPHPEKWIAAEDYQKLRPLERACLDFYKGAFDHLTGRSRNLDALDPHSFGVLRNASGMDLENALINLRRSCRIQEPTDAARKHPIPSTLARGKQL